MVSEGDILLLVLVYVLAKTKYLKLLLMIVEEAFENIFKLLDIVGTAILRYRKWKKTYFPKGSG